MEQSAGAEPDTSEPTRDNIPDGQVLFEQLLEAIRKDRIPPRQRYKTFSTRDFPTKGKPVNYYRPASIPILIGKPHITNYMGNDGFMIIKVDDGFGNIRCLQERGVKEVFELINPILWYPIPAATCSFIK